MLLITQRGISDEHLAWLTTEVPSGFFPVMFENNLTWMTQGQSEQDPFIKDLRLVHRMKDRVHSNQRALTAVQDHRDKQTRHDHPWAIGIYAYADC
jgi:hypothetical protein